MDQDATTTANDSGPISPPAPPCPPPAPVAAFCAAAPAVQVTERPYPSSVVVCGVALYKDALFCVFRHLDLPTLLSAARVCRLFSLMAREDSLWMRLSGKESQFCTSYQSLRREGLQFSFTGAQKQQCRRKIDQLHELRNQSVTCRRCHKSFQMTYELIRKQYVRMTLCVAVPGKTNYVWCESCYANLGLCPTCGHRSNVTVSDVAGVNNRFGCSGHVCQKCATFVRQI